MRVNSVVFDVKITEYKGHELYVPEYTRYMACDADGRLFAYASKPVADEYREEWFPAVNPRCECIAHMDVGADWFNTLEEVL